MPWFLHPRRLLGAVILATVAFVIWQMSVPKLGGNFNESAAIATLKNLRTQQQQFLVQRAIDRDGDGKGEAGFVEELRGTRPLRAADGAAGRRLEPPLLSKVFATVEDGRVHWHGYWFQLHLPTADGRWAGSWEQRGEVGIDASEGAFCIYAWPADESSGRRAFFTDANGDTLASCNAGWRYCGLDRPVPVDAALPSSAVGQPEPGGRTGRDGQIWVVIE